MVRAGAQNATRDRSTVLKGTQTGFDPLRISEVAETIAPHVRRTPVLEIDDDVVVKLEHLQHVGTFKVRGAFANMLLLGVPEAGVVAASGGNHGSAVAYAAGRLGVPATIFVPSFSSPAKQERIRKLGATLVICDDIPAAFDAADAFELERGAFYVHPFESVETMLGNGTVVAEFAEQATFDTILVQVGGGGLIGSTSAYFGGRVRVIGVEPEGAPTLAHALAAGKPVVAPMGSVAADSLGPPYVGTIMYPFAEKYVERVVLVSDDAIRNAQAQLWERARIVVEPGGATGYAALLSGAYDPAPGERVGILLTGGNTVAVDFSR